MDNNGKHNSKQPMGLTEWMCLANNRPLKMIYYYPWGDEATFEDQFGIVLRMDGVSLILL